jgi:guanine deaminase
MPGQLSDADRRYLQRAIQISRRALEDDGKTPFGALVVIDGQIVGEGTSRVVELHDPTAHAEVMALRAAGEALGTHLFETGVLYCSSEPCPMCLVACYWARLPRLVFAATSYDVATSGFEDFQLYRELTLGRDQRSLREDSADEDLRQEAASALSAWTDKLPFTIEPKY